MTNDNLSDVSAPQSDDPAPGPMHRAPPPGWVPLSGFALSMFIISLLVGVISVPFGLWWAPALCIVFSVVAFLRAKPGRVRGRGFAVSAIVLSLLTGTTSFMLFNGLRTHVEFATSDICHAFDAGVPEAEGLLRIQGWLHEDIEAKTDGDSDSDEEERADESSGAGAESKAGSIARDILRRFRLLEARMGAFKQALPPVSIIAGSSALFSPPEDDALREIGDPEEAPPKRTLGSVAMWGRAQFERGEVRIALFLMTMASLGDVKDGHREGTRRVKMFRDVRFYVPPVAK